MNTCVPSTYQPLYFWLIWWTIYLRVWTVHSIENGWSEKSPHLRSQSHSAVGWLDSSFGDDIRHWVLSGSPLWGDACKVIVCGLFCPGVKGKCIHSDRCSQETCVAKMGNEGIQCVGRNCPLRAANLCSFGELPRYLCVLIVGWYLVGWLNRVHREVKEHFEVRGVHAMSGGALVSLSFCTSASARVPTST